MIVKRSVKPLLAATCALGLGLAVGSCSGFSGYVSDHWPRWAGGMPDDVPPRPGAPGYDEFIAHGQADQMTAKPAAASAAAAGAKLDGIKPGAATPGPKTAATAAQPIFQQIPAAPPAPANDQPAEDQSVVKGGLY